MTPQPSRIPPDLSAALPRELVLELLTLARSGGAEFAEVYAEHATHSGFAYDEQRLKTSSLSVTRGLGVRAVIGEQTGYAYADGFAPADLRDAARVAARIARDGVPGRAPRAFRVVDAPAPFTLAAPAPVALDEPAKIALLRRADEAARAHDGRIHEVAVSFGDAARAFVVANSDGLWAEDHAYLSRLMVDALALEAGDRQSGTAAGGGCVDAGYYDAERTPEAVALEAARSAVTLLGAREPEAGSYPVVVSPGWGGVMVHECFGHGMEGDTIRKRTSIRAAQRGQQVAARGVTIVDSGRVPYSRGSFRIDDEGTPAQRTVLVEDGILVGYLWDVLNARLTGERPTGNGRRASYRHVPLCRMTNTYIEPGPHAPEDLIASLKRGLYCRTLGGGSVSPADGNFSFQVTEAVMIEDGRLTHPVRNATLTGNGNDAMLRIDAVGNDLRIDGTTGSCGKDGQWKPVGVGQPTLLFSRITVGGDGDVSATRGDEAARTPAALERLGAQAVEIARRAGAAAAEACVETSRAFTVEVNGGAIEHLKQSGTLGLGLRVVVDDRVGFVTTNDLAPAAVEDLARRAVALARLSSPDPANALVTPEEAGDAPAGDLDIHDPAVPGFDPERKIALALELERIALAHDPRIRRTEGAGVSSSDGAVALVTSTGIVRSWAATSASLWVVPLADDRDGRQQTGFYHVTKRHLRELPSAETAAREAAARAVARIGARGIATVRVPVVMHPDVAASWIAEMHDAFSGESVIKQSSWLTERLGTTVASPRVTLVDDGRLRAAVGTEPFDGEGVATRRNVLIDRGRCAMFLYDVYHARRAGTRPTGSAVRGYASLPGIGAQNLYLEPGPESAEAILARVDRGFYMDGQGSYGFNGVSGDYSFQAQGFWIEGGARAYPVDGVTVAANSLDMLRDVVAVGSDLEFRGSVASPTLLIAEMTVSGAGG